MPEIWTSTSDSSPKRKKETVVDEILLRRARRRAKRRPIAEIEKEARWETWKAYSRRMDGRLFDPGPHEGQGRRQWDYMYEEWGWKAIGCVARLDTEPPDDGPDLYPYSFEDAILVGVFMGVQGGWFGGAEFVVGHFAGPGTSTHRSPLNIGFVHVLGGPYQELVDINYADDDEDPGGWDEC